MQIEWVPPTPLSATALRRRWHERACVLASHQFDKLRRQATLRGLLGLIVRRQHLLLRLPELSQRSIVAVRRLPNTQSIPIEKIVGSQGRSHDFDREFAPLHDHMRERWVSLAAIWYEGRALPPVELVQLDNGYYISDGHHRVSAARAFGEHTIEASVVVWQTVSSVVSVPVGPNLVAACAAD